MQPGLDRFQESAKPKDNPLRLGLDSVIGSPYQDDQQDGRRDEGDGSDRDARQLRAAKGGQSGGWFAIWRASPRYLESQWPEEKRKVLRRWKRNGLGRG